MGLWAIGGVMIAAALALIARALRRDTSAAATHPDLAVYRAQLAEVDRDIERGLIGSADAKGLRNEIARRILDLDRQPPAASSRRVDGSDAVPLAVAAAALVGSILLYGRLGAPDYPAFPHAERIAAAERLRAERPSQAEAEASAPPAAVAPDPAYSELVDQLRASTVEHPEKVEGFRLLAQHEANLGNLAAAARAKAREMALLGADQVTATDHAGLADLMIRAAGGIVTAEAETELQAALALDPTLGTARFYAGLAEAQYGRPDLAFAIWQPLHEESPPDAPWVGFLDEQLGFVAAAAGVDYEPRVSGGPDAADVAAAAALSAEDRDEMIRGMVSGLETRLMAEGGSAMEWVQLLEALAVLGEPDRAGLAWAEAKRRLAGDADALAQVQAAAEQAGITQ